MIEYISELFSSAQVWVYILDILLVAYVNYRLLKLIRGKRAWRIVVGIFFFIGALIISDRLQLTTLHWILDKATLLAPVALVILFLPELRQAVEGFGKLGIWTERLITQRGTTSGTLQEIATAVGDMAENRIGALIVIERGTALQDIAENGTPIQGKVTAPLIGAMFYHGNPLHDGAIIVRGDEIVAAACRLPMSESRTIESHYHMRHRAGIGMSEQSDAVVIIVSEERGEIAVAIEGELDVMANEAVLREFLDQELQQYQPKKRIKRLLRKKQSEVQQEETVKEVASK